MFYFQKNLQKKKYNNWKTFYNTYMKSIIKHIYYTYEIFLLGMSADTMYKEFSVEIIYSSPTL